MQLRFEANQEHQLRAVEALAALLDGQPRVEASLAFAPDTGFAAVPNRLDLTDDALLHNLRLVQQANGLPQDDALRWIESPIETAEGAKSARFPNFSVEMETGTGKTYVYLRTALTLFQRFGLRKFIVVVPSVAIREGVLKTLRITEGHLRELFGNPPYRFYAYDSANVTQLRQFALSDGVEVMVMTIDSFNKASNVIRQNTDRLPGVELPLHLVQAARPVLILDEPQNLESELRVRSLSALDPLFALRFSATHRDPYNLIFRLTPYDAYRQGLVKRIEVAGIEGGADASRVFLRLDEIRWGRGPLTARIAVHKRMASGTVREQPVTVRSGDGLEAKSGRSEYAPFVVEEIDAGEGWVRFANGIQLRTGEVRGEDREAIFREQIRYTIEDHFRRQAKVRDAGIKVLSLFFIDRVDNYAREDGIIRRLFVQEFDRVKARYPEWADLNAEDVQAAYFASHRKRSGEVVYEDSTSGEAEKDRLAYDLIMRDKEELLTFPSPADP
jgi:type III restriction enzyme